jgi:hypothetical protein
MSRSACHRARRGPKHLARWRFGFWRDLLPGIVAVSFASVLGVAATASASYADAAPPARTAPAAAHRPLERPHRAPGTVASGSSVLAVVGGTGATRAMPSPRRTESNLVASATAAPAVTPRSVSPRRPGGELRRRPDRWRSRARA